MVPGVRGGTSSGESNKLESEEMAPGGGVSEEARRSKPDDGGMVVNKSAGFSATLAERRSVSGWKMSAEVVNAVTSFVLSGTEKIESSMLLFERRENLDPDPPPLGVLDNNDGGSCAAQESDMSVKYRRIIIINFESG